MGLLSTLAKGAGSLLGGDAIKVDAMVSQDFLIVSEK